MNDKSESVIGLDQDARVRRLGELDRALGGYRGQMAELVRVINRIFGQGVFRARVHSQAGVLAVRLWWRNLDGAADRGRVHDSSFELMGRAGLKLLNLLSESQCRTLLQLERERVWLNHHYRVAFMERKSLRKLHSVECLIDRYPS